MTEETKKKLSESHKGKQCGEDNPFYGKRHSDSTKAILREKTSSMWNDPNSKVNSKEYRAKLSAAATGRKLSEDTRQKIAASKARPVQQYTEDDIYVATYPSIKEAVRALGYTSQSHIADVCNGKRKVCYGYK